MLDAAHRGYDYQDLMVALRLVDVALDFLSNVWVDEKLVDNDRFDDLTVVDLDGRRLRTQFKHRDDGTVPLPLNTFTSDKCDLRLDRLVAAALADRNGPGNCSTIQQFRLVLRDARPSDPKLTAVLRPALPDPRPFVSGMQTVRLRFDVSSLWPQPMTAVPDAHVKAFARVRKLVKSRTDLEWLCERLIVEVEAPEASFDLLQTGKAEKLLLERVSSDVGAGYYPNQDRSPTDVALSFINLARAARQCTAKITKNELLRRARLRQDFGAVERAQPVDVGVEISRTSTVAKIVESSELAAKAGVPLLITGSPGQGKSWACQRVVDALKSAGWLVAEHSCFLDSADLPRDERVMVEAVFGTLLARLAEHDPNLIRDQRPRGAGLESPWTKASLSKLSQRKTASPPTTQGTFWSTV